jgi:predicted lipoprotein with Yx(FWY)xxD motif
MTNHSRHNLSRKSLSRMSVFAAGAASILLLTAACGGSSGTAAPASSGAATTKSGAATISTASTGAGQILVDAQGRTMYAFAADSKGKSNCEGSCLTYWPAVPAGSKTPTGSAGVTATLGVLHRQDGTAQLTVDGWPMYTYIGDSKPGSTAGQGKNLSGGLWWVVSPSGKWITKGGSATGTTSKSPSGRYGTGY